MAIWKGSMFLILIGILALVAGCVTRGKPFDEQLLPRIREGKTTKVEIQDLMGTPFEKGLEGGLETWTYRYLRDTVTGDLRSKELKLWFDDKGLVKSLSYTTNYAPWQVTR